MAALKGVSAVNRKLLPVLTAVINRCYYAIKYHCKVIIPSPGKGLIPCRPIDPWEGWQVTSEEMNRVVD